MENAKLIRKRGLSHDGARIIRLKGHTDEQEFALAIGLAHEYVDDIRGKKDVVDLNGDAHSVKGGEKKWQVFLYSLSRFENDFVNMNGMGELLAECIKSFPESFEEYQKNKIVSKEHLRPYMVMLAKKLQDKVNLKMFLSKAIFNNEECRYLTVKEKGIFHVFSKEDVLNVMIGNLEVFNSRALSKRSFPEQKVILRYKGKNLGEIEMRNDSLVHYREIRFNMIKPRVMKLLFDKIPVTKEYSKIVLVHGSAAKRFGRWK